MAVQLRLKQMGASTRVYLFDGREKPASSIHASCSSYFTASCSSCTGSFPASFCLFRATTITTGRFRVLSQSARSDLDPARGLVVVRHQLADRRLSKLPHDLIWQYNSFPASNSRPGNAEISAEIAKKDQNKEGKKRHNSNAVFGGFAFFVERERDVAALWWFLRRGLLEKWDCGTLMRADTHTQTHTELRERSNFLLGGRLGQNNHNTQKLAVNRSIFQSLPITHTQLECRQVDFFSFVFGGQEQPPQNIEVFLFSSSSPV